MRVGSWPEPPVHGERAPPRIPEKIMMFGLAYDCAGGSPRLDIETEPLDPDRIDGLVSSSLSNFKRLARTLDPAYLNGIRDAHIQLNEALNRATLYEGDRAIAEAAARRLRAQMDAYRAMKRILRRPVQ